MMNEDEVLALAEERYKDAISKGEIDEIISCGQDYFSKLRRAPPTSEDRESIQNQVFLATKLPYS